jgi:ABC-type branched-subunit amino acid transport system permease subunit
VSFGHAAWFGAGAYAAALLVTRAGLPMEAAIPAAPLFAGCWRWRSASCWCGSPAFTSPC